MKSGKSDEAVICFQNGLRINPNDPDLHNNLGVVLAGKGNLQEAEYHFQKALQINPDYTDAKNNLNKILTNRR